MNKKGFKAKIVGRAQGVYFRKNTQKQALKWNLTGWVKNHDDGSVLVEAFGDEANLIKLKKWLHKGPILAKVKQVQIEDIPFQTHQDFLILP